MKPACVIFDLDGTLVDSERLCSQGYLDLLPEITDPLEVFFRRYRGIHLATICESIEERFGLKLPADFERAYRARVAELFDSQLKIMPGVEEMLAAVDLPRCIATNGPPAKMRRSLEIVGIAQQFEGRMYSAYDVGHWKPDPRLFLHAAGAMGFAPQECIVVEDSAPGVHAAIAAGMQVLQYRPEAEFEDYGAAAIFTHMAQLPDLIARIRSPRS